MLRFLSCLALLTILLLPSCVKIPTEEKREDIVIRETASRRIIEPASTIADLLLEKFSSEELAEYTFFLNDEPVEFEDIAKIPRVSLQKYRVQNLEKTIHITTQ